MIFDNRQARQGCSEALFTITGRVIHFEATTIFRQHTQFAALEEVSLILFSMPEAMHVGAG
jgi:hypothetical protein